MERWCGKLAVVTGASSGIGWAICKELVQGGMKVVGLARRVAKMEEQRSELDEELKDSFHPRLCDVSSLSSVKEAFQWIEECHGNTHVLVNNAGMAETCKFLDEGNEDKLKRSIDVNVMGMVYTTKQAYSKMLKAMESGEECHIVTVLSLLAHRVPVHIPDAGLNIYPVAKHALRAMQEVLRREMHAHELLRLSTISPGLTETEFGQMGETKSENKKEAPWFKIIKQNEILQPEDLARGVRFIIESPWRVTIREMLLMPSRELY